MFNRNDFPRIVGTREVAAMLNVSTQRVDQLARESASTMSRSLSSRDDEPRFIEAVQSGRLAFPTPVAELACGRIWLADEIDLVVHAVPAVLVLPVAALPIVLAAFALVDLETNSAGGG